MVGGLLFSFFIALTSFKLDKVAYRIRKMEVSMGSVRDVMKELRFE